LVTRGYTASIAAPRRTGIAYAAWLFGSRQGIWAMRMGHRYCGTTQRPRTGRPYDILYRHHGADTNLAERSD